MEHVASIQELENRIDEGVMSFIVDMKYKLRLNNHKGHWKEYGTEHLLKLLKEEINELESAIRLANKKPITTTKQLIAIIQESADCANFAMMIADNCKRLMRTIDGAQV